MYLDFAICKLRHSIHHIVCVSKYFTTNDDRSPASALGSIRSCSTDVAKFHHKKRVKLGEDTNHNAV